MQTVIFNQRETTDFVWAPLQSFVRAKYSKLEQAARVVGGIEAIILCQRFHLALDQKNQLESHLRDDIHCLCEAIQNATHGSADAIEFGETIVLQSEDPMQQELQNLANDLEFALAEHDKRRVWVSKSSGGSSAF